MMAAPRNYPECPPTDVEISSFLDHDGRKLVREFLDDVETVNDAPGLVDMECKSLGRKILKHFAGERVLPQIITDEHR